MATSAPDPPPTRPRKSSRIKSIAQQINPSRVVAMLAEVYGLSKEPLSSVSFADRALFERVVKLFPKIRIAEKCNLAKEIDEESVVADEPKTSNSKRSGRPKTNPDNVAASDTVISNVAPPLTTEIRLVSEEETGTTANNNPQEQSQITADAEVSHSVPSSPGSPAASPPPDSPDDPEIEIISMETEKEKSKPEERRPIVVKPISKPVELPGKPKPNIILVRPINPTASTSSSTVNPTKVQIIYQLPPAATQATIVRPVTMTKMETSTKKSKSNDPKAGPSKPKPKQQQPDPTASTSLTSTSIYTFGSSSESEEDFEDDDSEDYQIPPPSPPFSKPQIDPVIMEKAYRYWTKQSPDLNVPLIVDPDLMKRPANKDEKKKKYSIGTVLGRYPKVGSGSTLINYHKKLLNGGTTQMLYRKIDHDVYEKYLAARERHEVVRSSTLRQWAFEAKAKYDTQGRFEQIQFSEGWIGKFKQRHGIKLREEQPEVYAPRARKPRRRYYRLKGEPAEPQFDEFGFRIHPDDQGEPRYDRGVMKRLNARVVELYNEAVASGQKVTSQSFFNWAAQVKAEIDPKGMLLFAASGCWLYHLKKKHGISLGKKRKEPEEDAEVVNAVKQIELARPKRAAASKAIATITQMDDDETEISELQQQENLNQPQLDQAVASISQNQPLPPPVSTYSIPNPNPNIDTDHSYMNNSSYHHPLTTGYAQIQQLGAGPSDYQFQQHQVYPQMNTSMPSGHSHQNLDPLQHQPYLHIGYEFET